MADIVDVALLLEGIEFGGGDTLIPVLANHIADHMDEFTEQQVRDIVDAMFSQITANIDGDRTIINICLVALTNLTVSEANAEVFCKHTISEDGGYVPREELHMLIKSFVQHSPQQEDQGWNYYPKVGFSSDMIREDPWAYVGMILTNIVRCENGRKLILRQSLDFMQPLCSQIQSFNPVRRRGSVGTLRTCCFDTEIHWWLLHEAKVLTNMLMPCVVATPFTESERQGMNPTLWIAANDPMKKHESEADILIMLLESIVLLCQKRPIREDLRKMKVYPICRNLDYLQENERVSEIILEIVNFMHRDEEESPEERQARIKAASDKYEAEQLAKKDMLFTPNDVLAFWLGDDYNQEDAFTTKVQFDVRMSKWFNGDKVFKDIQMKNEALIRKAASGELDSDDLWDSPKGILAKILLLDQFSRCVYRGTSNAFQHDELVQKIVLDMLTNETKGPTWIKYYYRPIERFWITIALQHSETMISQNACQRMYIENILTEGATEEMKNSLEATKEFATSHHAVVSRFGRMPGRNAALCRENTAEEIQWLISQECPHWTKSQQPKKNETTGDEEDNANATADTATEENVGLD